MLLLLFVLPDIPEEDRLLAQARNGNKEAIARIYRAYFDPLYQFIRWRVDDLSVAEDLAGDVFIKFLTALQGPSAPQHSLRGWLFRVARNVLHDYYQNTDQFVVLDDELDAVADAGVEAQIIRLMDAEQVRRAVRALPTDYQEVLVLRFGQLLSLRDTAQSMNRSVGAIKLLQFRAINALRRMLTQQGNRYDES